MLSAEKMVSGTLISTATLFIITAFNMSLFINIKAAKPFL
jgi:hypothetical protein